MEPGFALLELRPQGFQAVLRGPHGLGRLPARQLGMALLRLQVVDGRSRLLLRSFGCLPRGALGRERRLRHAEVAEGGCTRPIGLMLSRALDYRHWNIAVLHKARTRPNS